MLGASRTVVLAIDDLQWAYLDSALLLKRLLRPPDPPRLLLLGRYRSEDAKRSPFLQDFLNPADQREVRLEASTEPEALELAKHLPSQRGLTEAQSAAYAQASQGIPVDLEMLVQHAPPEGDPPAFESVVAECLGL